MGLLVQEDHFRFDLPDVVWRLNLTAAPNPPVEDSQQQRVENSSLAPRNMSDDDDFMQESDPEQ